jgi:HTH-type transcriptional regulator, transcriptional repressor of NAD biosynthesis genes
MAYKSTGLVVGKFAPFHHGHKFVIDTALEKVDNVIVLVYSNPDFPDIPTQVRANWIRQIYKGKPVYVFTPKNPPPNDADDFTQREFVKQWLEQHCLIYPSRLKLLYESRVGPFAPKDINHAKGLFGSTQWIDTVYGSDDYIPGFAKHIGAKHQIVDTKRSKHPVSGTEVRAYMKALEHSASIDDYGSTRHDEKGFYDFWFTPDVVTAELRFWMQPIKKVVFLGAESTGKSTLTERMAKEFNVAHVAEYGREYYEKKGGELELQDYVNIAKEHRRLEDRATVELAKNIGRYIDKKSRSLVNSEAQSYLFIDTNAITTLFFSYYYNQGGLPELHGLANDCKNRYHHVFVCTDDIPFSQDGWRDNEIWRGRMQGMVLHDLDARGIYYTVVHGDLEQRVQQVKTILAGGDIQSVVETKHLGPRPRTVL